MAVSFAGLLMIALLLGLLLSARTRVAGLILLTLIVVGMFYRLASVSNRPTQYLVDVNAAPDDVLLQQRQLDSEAKTRAAEAHARAAAEVLKNQRLAARMPDGILQISPDGSQLETYPDGMQIREDYRSRQRSLVRDADPDSATRSLYTSQTTREAFALWLFGVPFAALALAFVAVKAKKGGWGGWPAAMAILGCLPLLFFFTAASQARREVRSGTDATVSEVPLSTSSKSTTVRRSPKFIEDGHGVVIPIPQPVVPHAAAQREFARVFSHELGEDDNLAESASGPSSIDTIWAKLTKPRIELDSPKPVTASPSKAEIAQAAKIILTASVPVADPFTQGWLVNAAKAIVQAVPRADEDKGASIPFADASSEYAQVQPYIYDDPSAGVAGLRLKQLAGPRPDWIDDSPLRVGNAQRIPVSSDPFTTADECRGQLLQKVEAVVQARVRELARQANNGQHAHVPELRWLGIDSEYIAAELCSQGEYVETISTSVGPMKRVHTLVEFTPPQEQYLLDRWLNFVRMENLGAVAGLSILVVGGLALMYGLLKIDTWTRGYYTKRLFIGVPAAIIAVLSVAALFVP